MLNIRLGRRDDIVELADIEASAAKLFPANKTPKNHETLPFEVLKEAIENQLLFCIEDSGLLVGFAACHQYLLENNSNLSQENNKSLLHLDEIDVLPSQGKNGLGTLLVQHVLKVSQELQLIGTTLTTFSDIPWNAPFYKKLGFEIISDDDIPEHVQAMLVEEDSIGLKNRVPMLYTTQQLHKN